MMCHKGIFRPFCVRFVIIMKLIRDDGSVVGWVLTKLVYCSHEIGLEQSRPLKRSQVYSKSIWCEGTERMLET